MPPRPSRSLRLAIALAVAIPVVSTMVACGNGGSGDADAGTPDAQPAAPLAPLRMRRLLRRQYINTVRDLLGSAAADAADPPLDLAAHGFESIGATELALSDSAVAQYELSARAVAETVVRAGGPNIDQWIPCTPTGAGDSACLRSFIETFGERAFRRPLETEEVERYLTVATNAAAEYDSFSKGVEYGLLMLLQSQNFLYQVEIGETDPDYPDRLRLTGYEVATRMSYFLMDTTPTAELMAAAAAGTLYTAGGIRDASRDLLSRPGARFALDAFYEERMQLRLLATLPKDPKVFPEFDARLAESMRREAIELLNYIVWESDADYRELLTARYAFVNAPLAALYGVAPPTNPDVFEYRLLPDEQQRSGILGQAAFLAGLAHPALTSPTRRGRFIAERFLCQKIPPPPPDVAPELPEDPGGMPETMRDKLSRHREDPACSSCHDIMDPLGLPLEGFDAVGRFRTTDRGLALDLTGDIDGVGFDGPVEMADALVASPDFHRCFVKNIYKHATGHIEVFGEYPTIDGLTIGFESDGYRIQELLVELVSSEGFRFAAPHEEGQ